MTLLFDLDQTLVDSRASEALRRRRAWSAVYDLVPQCAPFDGVADLFASLRNQGVRIAVVTNGPRPYCERVLAHWNLRADATVCWHDTARHKPHPDPFLEALRRLGEPAARAVAVGDHPHDVLAARAAGIRTVGALWGASDAAGLLAARPDFALRSVGELAAALGRIGVG